MAASLDYLYTTQLSAQAKYIEREFNQLRISNWHFMCIFLINAENLKKNQQLDSFSCIVY